VTRHGLIADPAEFQKEDLIGLIVEAWTVHKRGDIWTVTIAGALKTMTKSPLKLVAPATVNRTVTMPRRKPNSVYRTREHLTGAEVDRLIDAAEANRWGHRDATMILVAFRHGLRSSELVDLRWDQIDFIHAVLHVCRAKKGTPATHPVVGDQMRALRKLQREQDPKSPFVFEARRSLPVALPSLWNVPGSRPSWASKPIPTRCGTPVASHWRTKGTIHEPCAPIWDTRTSSTP